MLTSNDDTFERWVNQLLSGYGLRINAGDKTYTFMKETPKVTNPFEIQSLLSNRAKSAFTVVWKDGTTTVVHCQEGDEWDDEKALAMCFTKKALGNKGNFNDKFNDALNNKMKVVSAKEVPTKAPKMATGGYVEKCNCNPPCVECKCNSDKAENGLREAIEKMKESASIASEKLKATLAGTEKKEALTDTINKLINDTSDYKYRLFIKQDGTIIPAGHYNSPSMLKQRAKYLATELFGRDPHYYRLWMENGRTVIDFGSYSKFLVLEGITPEDWNHN